MEIGFNFMNGIIIFILIALFILDQYFDYTFLAILYLILSFGGAIFFSYIKQSNNALICFYFLLFFIFYSIGELYENKNSIQSLIDYFELNERDLLTYKFSVNQDGGINKCKISGDYDGKKEENQISETIPSSAHCTAITENTELKFILGHD